MNLTWVLICLILLSCGKATTKKKFTTSPSVDVSSIHTSSRVEVRVFYEPGAEPYTEGLLGLKLWNTLEANLKALFPQVTPAYIIVPKDLSAMSKISAQNKSAWNASDLQSLADLVGSTAPSGTTAFNVFFVNGYSEKGSGIIGFQVSGTKNVILFKRVIESTSNQSSDPFVPRYVEQATLVHELGHAVGLVNNGIPDSASHQDSAHGHHCNNPECVMYYANEGRDSMLTFARNVLDKKTVIMFDSACLGDTQKYQSSLK